MVYGLLATTVSAARGTTASRPDKGWSYEVHELSEGFSAIVYDEHGQAIADHLPEDCAALISAAPELRAALRWFLEDERFQVSVGGNPNVVNQMLAAARAALAKSRVNQEPLATGAE